MDNQQTKRWEGLEDYINLLMGRNEREFNQMDPGYKIRLVQRHAKQINFQFDKKGRLFVDRNYVGDKEEDKKVNYYHTLGLIDLNEAYRLAVVVELIQEGITREDSFVFDLAKKMNYDLIQNPTIKNYFNSSFVETARAEYRRITSPAKSKSRKKLKEKPLDLLLPRLYMGGNFGLY